MSIEGKIAAALLFVLIVASASTALLAYVVYERTLSALVVGRFDFIAREVQRKVEAGLDLGLPLGELDINAVLRHERQTDEALQSLSIVDANGLVLFSTDAALAGRTLDVPALAAMAASADPHDMVIVGEAEVNASLVNSFGRLVGALAIRYDSRLYAGKRRATARAIAGNTALALLLCGFAGVAGTAWLCRPLQRAMLRLEGSGHEAAPPGTAGAVLVAARGGGGDVDLAGFDPGVLEAARALARAETLLLPECRAGEAA